MSKYAMQGDAFPLSFSLKESGTALSPDRIAELEVCIGEKIRKTYSGGDVKYEPDYSRWSFRLSQTDTMQLECLVYHDIIARVKYDDNPESDVKGVLLGTLYLYKGRSKEVL